MTTPLEAYLTGVVFVSVSNPDNPMPVGLRPVTATDEEGTILGIIQLVDPNDNVRVSIFIQEHPR